MGEEGFEPWMSPLKISEDVNQLNYKALNKQMLITFLKKEYINFWRGINFSSIQRKLQKSNQVNFFFMPWKVKQEPSPNRNLL